MLGCRAHLRLPIAMLRSVVHNLLTRRAYPEWNAHEQHPIAIHGATADGFNATGMPPERDAR
jgi:hypothetical protein